MRKLDRSRHFAEVRGDASAPYLQDGLEFDHEGNEIVAPAAPLDVADMPIVELRDVMKSLGEKYVNKAQAVQFIEQHLKINKPV